QDETTEATTKAERLGQLFDNLPSTTSRTDLLRVFTRHLLIAEARKSQCHALLLGSSTTALAELTLSETAKGRGFSLPWQINDGVLGVPSFSPNSSSSKPDETGILIYHPLRDALRKELVTFTKLSGEPTPIADLLPETDLTTTAAVVSHKDLSIEEVMVRYFADVEENYPSIVANVARTTGKLMRLFGGGGAGGGAGVNGDEGEGASRVNGEDDGSDEEVDDDERLCGLCSMPLDEFGDERWKGELGEYNYRDVVVGGEGEKKTKQRVCYGCERSIRG
ncbi:Cytoplasmic tRNA 2-thiolation protein 2, partial [Neurospora sp. IMI 360204]